MSNFLTNGAVLPFGLLSSDTGSAIAAFNRSYKNTALRVGVITASHPIGDKNNINKLTIEYEVSVLEQNECESITAVTYSNCICSESFGSIADFFEKSLRPMKSNKNKKNVVDLKNQNGSIVLIHCLDGMTAKAIIVGSLTHPDRKTTLTSSDPYLEGEYNGVNIKVGTDGSTSLTFNGPTDNDGNTTTANGGTVFQIKADGSFEFKHSSIDILADKSGALTITTKANCSIQAQGDLVANCTNATITASGNANVTASGTATVEGQTVNLGKAASDAVIKGDTFKTYFDAHQVMTALGPSSPPIMPMPPTSLSKKVKTE
jgi:hypothetical protein